MRRLIDSNGVPTVEGARAMFEATDEAAAHRRAYRFPDPPPATLAPAPDDGRSAIDTWLTDCTSPRLDRLGRVVIERPDGVFEGDLVSVGARLADDEALALEADDDELQGDGAGDDRAAMVVLGVDFGTVPPVVRAHRTDADVVYRYDEQARRVVFEVDGEPCGALPLRPELLHRVPPNHADLARRLREITTAPDGDAALREQADLVILAISLAAHAAGDDALGVAGFPGVLELLDDHRPIGSGWGTSRDTVLRRMRAVGLR